MLSKEMVANRLETGISYTEFSYMVLQAYDFYNLYNHEQCYIQSGGSDQWGNITAGLELIRKQNGDEHHAAGITINLLTKTNGEKYPVGKIIIGSGNCSCCCRCIWRVLIGAGISQRKWIDVGFY